VRFGLKGTVVRDGVRVDASAVGAGVVVEASGAVSVARTGARCGR
jgi:stage V sporulation protein SpoVS